MLVSTAIQDYLLEIEIRQYTPRTIRSYRLNLGSFHRFLLEYTDVREIEGITPVAVRQFSRFYTERGRKGTYINSMLKSVKSFIQYCYEEGYGGFDTRRSFKWCKEEKPIIQVFQPADVKKMLRACTGNDFLSVRDRTILTMLFETGIRCLELCCIQPADIHDNFIIINGKNHKQRVVPITAVLRKTLLRYNIAAQNYYALKPIDDYYFLSFRAKQLTVSAVEHGCYRWK